MKVYENIRIYKNTMLQLDAGAPKDAAAVESSSSGGSGSGSILNLVAPLVGSSSGVSFTLIP